MSNNLTVYVDFDVDSVRVWNSFKITKRKDMLRYVETIKTHALCPACVRSRGNKSLIREWESHNFMYRIGFEVHRTMHVDFDDEPFGRRMVYALLSVLYRLGL